MPVLSASTSLHNAADVASRGCSKQKHSLVVLELDNRTGGGRRALVSSLAVKSIEDRIAKFLSMSP